MLALLLACLSMAGQDTLGVFLVVAETRGRAVLAGAMDALGDLARQLVTIYAAGAVLKGGWSGHAIVILAAVMVTSFIGTIIDTRLSRRIKAAADDLEARVAALESATEFKGMANL